MISYSKNILLLGVILVGALSARTVDELKVAYEVKLLALEKDYRADLEKLASGYTGALDQVQEKLQKAGRLEDVLKVVEEKKDLKAGKWPLGLLEDSAPADLLRFRKIYETSRIKADRGHAAAVIETADKMDDLLEEQMKSLTREGKIAEAKKAKDLLEAIRKDQKIEAARELVQRVRLNQSAPVAYRLRRSGDHLEVLVRFDKSGKVSLDSPVENVIEVTGGRAEKGKTEATLLGEFVGAKGYKSFPFVAYESDMDKIVPPLRASGFELQANAEIEGRRALRVMLPDQVENPRVEWAEVLAPLASSSTLQINFSYFIPKENKRVKEFSMHWGFGAPIEKKFFSTTGRWVSESLESISLTNQTTLRLYGEKIPVANGKVNGGNEAIYLDDLKVTFLNFAAHIVEEYEDGKLVGKAVQEPTAQKAIVLAGKLLPLTKD